jgi:integrase
MRSVFANGKEDRKSLKHRDKEKAIGEAYELVRALLANEKALDEGSVTLGMVAELYKQSPAFATKKPRTRKADTRTLERVITFLGRSRNVETLSESDVQRFVLARRQGVGSLLRVQPGKVVRDQAIASDLVILMTALNWATRERTKDGRRLLKENPLHGVRLPREKNPKRPVMSHDVYLKLLEVAPRVHSLLPLALIVAEGTGRRISAWRNLVWDDIDFEAGTIHWRAEHDKKGYEQVVVMSESVRDALAVERKKQAAIGKTAVFPAPKDPTKPCNRHLFDDWLRRAFKLAKIVPQRRGMWHSIRRKWATERKGYPVKDVAAAGGWKTEEVLVTSYQQADAETIKNVVLHPTHRIVSR